MTSHSEWLANYHRDAELRRNERDARSLKLNAGYVHRSSSDEELVRGFETGEARSRPQSKPVSALASHTRRFIGNSRRHHPTSPDKAASRSRKRKWGGSSCLPDWMRGHYTEGERAVLAVLVQQVKRFGYCDLTINAIASLAGVHRTTVQNALREARKRKHVAVQERPGVAGRLSMTNVIRIVCGAWKGWLRRVGSGFKKLHPSEMKSEKKGKAEGVAPSQLALERNEEAPGIPPQRMVGPIAMSDAVWGGPNRSQWASLGRKGGHAAEIKPRPGVV